MPQINKTADRMYALLAICQALCPTKVDEGISTAMKEKFGEQHAKMVRGGYVPRPPPPRLLADSDLSQ
jgi:translation initiation factor 3 subunit L